MKFKLLPLTVALAAVLSPLTASATDAPEDFVFSGYARYGFHYSDDVNHYIGAEGGLTNHGVGRLGNENNGGEFQLTKGFLGANDTIWSVAVMLEHYGENVGLKKFYARATNVLDAQPNATFWAGRDFHQRPQMGLSDYFWMTHDGQGAGVYNLELGTVKLDISGVAQAAGDTNDSGNYAITSKLHDINLTDSMSLSFLANYGFTSKHDSTGTQLNTDTTAYQVAGVLDSKWSKGSNRFIVRYSDNADNSVFNKTEGQTALYTALEGDVKLSDSLVVKYLGSYASMAEDMNEIDDRSAYSAIVRPMYSWNSVHSTWLEAGYSLVDYDNLSDQNTAWKMTLSQNISIDAFGAAAPMLRFYATVGETDNQATSPDNKQDTLALGAMFESWW